MMDIASYCSVDWCARTLKSKYYCFDIQTGCFTMGYWMRRCVFSLCPCGALMRGDFVLQPMVNETQNPKWSPSAAHEQRRSDGAHPASATTPASKSFSWRIVQLLLAFLPSEGAGMRDTWTNSVAVCLLHLVERLDSYWPLEGDVARLLVNKVLLQLLGDVAVAVVVLIHALLQLVWLILEKQAEVRSDGSHGRERPVTETARMSRVKVTKLSQSLKCWKLMLWWNRVTVVNQITCFNEKSMKVLK